MFLETKLPKSLKLSTIFCENSLCLVDSINVICFDMILLLFFMKFYAWSHPFWLKNALKLVKIDQRQIALKTKIPKSLEIPVVHRLCKYDLHWSGTTCIFSKKKKQKCTILSYLIELNFNFWRIARARLQKCFALKWQYNMNFLKWFCGIRVGVSQWVKQ